jgi:hypothetical protein
VVVSHCTVDVDRRALELELHCVALPMSLDRAKTEG